MNRFKERIDLTILVLLVLAQPLAWTRQAVFVMKPERMLP